MTQIRDIGQLDFSPLPRYNAVMPKPTKAYFAKLGTGYRPDPYDARDRVFLAPPRILPRTIDNREECTPVRHQGLEGSCTGHALVAIAELLYWRKLGLPPDLSERWAYEKAKLYDEIKGTAHEGSTLRGVVKGWAKEGLPPEASWPYKSKKPGKAASDAKEKAEEHPLATYERCLGMENIRHAIHYRGCVIAGFTTHQGWHLAGGKRTIPYTPEYTPQGGHAVALVGYDDEKKVFWVKNSWGTKWGKKGYAGLTYQDALVNTLDAWVVSIPD